MVKKVISSKSNSSNNKLKPAKKVTKRNNNDNSNISLKEKNHNLASNSKDDFNLKKKKETIIKKRDDKHDLINNKENLNGRTKGNKKVPNSNIISKESSPPIVKTSLTVENKPGTTIKRNCLSAASSSSYSSNSSSSTSSSNSTSESVKNLSPTQRAVHRKYCETVKLKNQKKQLEEQQDHQNNSNNNNLKLFFKDKVIMLNIGTLTGKYFQIEAFWTDTIADLKEIIQDKEGILKESQILIYQGKSLINDNYTLRDYNLQDGATLKLALQMSGGPGAVNNVKKKKACDTVILLLCKKNNELLIFEINPNDDPSQSLIPKKVFQIDNNNSKQLFSNNPINNYQNNNNDVEYNNKKINYMPHLNNKTTNQQGNTIKSEGLSNNLLSPEIVQEIEKRAIASTLLGYNVTLAVQNLDNINENSGMNNKKQSYNNSNRNNIISNSSESNIKDEYLDENNNLIQNNLLSTDDEFKSEEIPISNINSNIINSLESKIQKHLFLDSSKENEKIYNDNNNSNININDTDNDNDSLFHDYIRRPPSILGSCSNNSYDTTISFPSRPTSAESDSSLTSLIQECTAAAASFRETINKSQQFLNMYLNSEEEGNHLDSLEYQNKDFKCNLSTIREGSPKPKKPFSSYLDIQELGTITISNNFANKTKYNYMPTIPSSSPYDNWDISQAFTSSTVNTTEKSKLSTRPSTAICITPIVNNIFPFMVMPKTRPSSAIEFSKSTKQYQMILSNLWVNSKFHKKYLEKKKKNVQSNQCDKDLIEEIVCEDGNKFNSEEFDQQISEENSFIIFNSSKKNNNDNNELEDIEEDIQYDYVASDDKINILDDLEFNLTKKLNYFCNNDNNLGNNKNSLISSQCIESITLPSDERVTEENVLEEISLNYDSKSGEIKEESEIPEIINTGVDSVNNDKLINSSFVNNYYDIPDSNNSNNNNSENNKNINIKDEIEDSKENSINKNELEFINNKIVNDNLNMNSLYDDNNKKNDNKDIVDDNINDNNEKKFSGINKRNNNTINDNINSNNNNIATTSTIITASSTTNSSTITTNDDNNNNNNNNLNIKINHKNNKINANTCLPTPTQGVNTKCHICNKKLGLMSGFKCKCGNIFCSIHRYSDSHNCTYDYKHQGKIQLTKNNPLFKNDKLVRI